MAKAALDLPGFANAVERTEDMVDLWWTTVRFFNAAGFGGVGYFVFSRGQPGEMSIMLFDGYPDRIVKNFPMLGFARHDPNFRYALATGRPSLRSRITQVTTLSPLERQHRKAREALGGGDTLALPVYGPHNYTGIISIGMAKDPDLFEKVSWPELHMAALSVHLKGLRLQPDGPTAPHNLSEREVEILCWVAQGKSNTVIADILSIARATVDTYLRRIFDKLNVADRTSAAVKGVSMGLIRI